MFPLCCLIGGQTFAFPDTCKVPTPTGPVPAPFPNLGDLMQINPGTAALFVKIMNQSAIHIGSEMLMTKGDEAGSAGGVSSGTIIGPAGFTSGSMKIKIEGQSAILVLSMTAQNGTSANAPGGQVLSSSQTLVLGGG